MAERVSLPDLSSDIIDRLDEAVFSSQPFSQALELVLDTALELLDAQYGSLRLMDWVTKKLVRQAVRRTSVSHASAEGDDDIDLQES